MFAVFQVALIEQRLGVKFIVMIEELKLVFEIFDIYCRGLGTGFEQRRVGAKKLLFTEVELVH